MADHALGGIVSAGAAFANSALFLRYRSQHRMSWATIHALAAIGFVGLATFCAVVQ